MRELNWGALSESLEGQLKNYGLKFKTEKKKERWEKLKFARSMLTINGFLTEKQSEQVVSKFGKAIHNDIEVMNNDKEN